MKKFLNLFFIAFITLTLALIATTAGPQAALITLFVIGVVLTPWSNPQLQAQLNLTTFNDKIYADGLFQQVVDLLAPLRAFTTDFSSSTRQAGDTVIVPLYGNATATTFTQATDVMEQTGGLVTAVTIPMNARKITPVDLTTGQLADSSGARNLDNFQMQMASATATMILTDVFSALTVASFGVPTTTASANFKLDAITAIRVALNAKKCPQMGRSIIIDDAVEAGIFSDTNLVLALNRGSNKTIDEGEVGRVLGFDIFTCTSFPLNSISLIGFACGKAAMAVAFRGVGDLLPDEEYAAKEVLTDNDSGISMLYTRHWSRAQAKWFLNVQALYGYVKAVTLQGHAICTATT